MALLFTRLRHLVLSACCLFGAAGGAFAQLPTCSGTDAGLIYTKSASAIRNYDPSLAISPTNPSTNTIAPPSGSSGLTVCDNINSSLAPSPTFYTSVAGNYYYHDGFAWVNTGHSIGFVPTTGQLVSFAGGGGYIYCLNRNTGSIYRYDGTGPAVLLMTVPGWGLSFGPHDISADCEGNYYVLRTTPLLTSTPPQPAFFRKYNPTGTLVDEYSVVVPTGAGSVLGMTTVGGFVYYNGGTTVYRGTITGSTVTFASYAALPLGTTPDQLASCPSEGVIGNPVNASVDTVYYCGASPVPPVPATLTVFGPGNYTWTVISGDATLSSTTGNTITVTDNAGTSLIVVEREIGSGCVAGTDTVTFIVPEATVDAGPSQTVEDCSNFRDTLYGSLTDTTLGITYTLAWAPASSVISGVNNDTAIVFPLATTLFTLTATTPAARGGCLFSDTASVTVINRSVDAQYVYTIGYGCDEDTVRFINQSTGVTIQPDSFFWVFGDGATDTARNPTHIYADQATYTVKLYIANGQCVDSTFQLIDLNHPLDAGFIVSNDSICQGTTVGFSDTSITTTRNGISPKYRWDFGDGIGTDSVQNPTYTFTRAGTFRVRLVVTDFVPCTDTQYMNILVDSATAVTLLLSDSVVCEGAPVRFEAALYTVGLETLTWNFGDGTGQINGNPVDHSYPVPGEYIVTATGDFRICPDEVGTDTVLVVPGPQVDLGVDTVICPNGEPIQLIADIVNPVNIAGDAVYPVEITWSTGDSASSILVRHHGVYWATIRTPDTLGACQASDSVEVRKNCYIDVPNAFTPNGDGDNDYFIPRQLLTDGLTRFNLTIYNRWGNIVYITQRLDGRGWDGRMGGQDQPVGVYVYLIEAEFANGASERYQGNLTLLR